MVREHLQAAATGVTAGDRKIYAVGYRPYDVGLPEPTSAAVTKYKKSARPVLTRRPRSRNFRALNFGVVPGHAPVSVDRSDPNTLLRAIGKRVGRDIKLPPRQVLDELGRFVDKWLADNVRPVDPLPFEAWLHQAPYTVERKKELSQVFEGLRGSPPTSKQCSHIKSFVKLESYPEFKEARWINSRSDQFKVYSGPAFHAIEEELYKHSWFIKHTPVPDRPKLISALRSSGLYYYENDYKAYESHFLPEIMRALEIRLYNHCLRGYPELRTVIERTLTGNNRLHTRCGISPVLKGRRMSGDMCTSLGNGFSNLMLVLFILHKKHGTGRGFVEGDDGLFATTVPLTKEDFAAIGFEVEIHRVNDPCHAHFCGMTVTNSGEVIKDPRRIFQTFGWTHSYLGAGHAIMDGLLKSKALSLAYELPQAPVIGQLARTALSLSQNCSAYYETGVYRPTPADFVGPTGAFNPSREARQMVASMFGISIDVQLAAEDAIRCHDMARLAELIPPSDQVLRYHDAYLEGG